MKPCGSSEDCPNRLVSVRPMLLNWLFANLLEKASVNRAYKYRLYPNKAQTENLNFLVEQGRLLYNAALQERKWAWKFHKVSINYYHQADQIKYFRRDDPDGIGKLNYCACQQILFRLDKAFANLFRRRKQGKRAGYPRFKSKKQFSSLRFVYNNGFRLSDDKLYIQNIGWIRLFQHRPIPNDAIIKQGIIKRDKLDKWYVCLEIESPDPEFISNDKDAIGIDMGINHFATFSTGEQVENPRWFRKSEERLANLHRRYAHTSKGTKRHEQLRYQIAKLHQHIANQRRDFQHKLSHRLVNEFGFIAIEDLNLKSLERGYVRKGIVEVSWGQFARFLAYKASSAGCQLVRVDPKYTSQTCPQCDSHVSKSLSDRIHNCPHCSYTAPRDIAAAQVILNRGMARTGPLQLAGS